jgi:hypothetical protein
MKEINLPSSNYLFVEVPDGSKEFFISGGNYPAHPKVYLNWKRNNYINNALIAEGFDLKFEIISTTKDITEEQAGSIVDKLYLGDKFMKFENYGFGLPKFNTAKESLQSLIQANGLDVNKNYLILKANG